MTSLVLKIGFAFLMGVFSQNIAIIGADGKRSKKAENIVTCVLFLLVIVICLNTHFLGS